MIARVLCAAALAAALLPASAAANEGASVESARELLAELRYDDARGELERVLAGGGAEPDELAATYLLLGEIEAALGNAVGARRHFRRALALDPGLSLAEGASPKLTEPFAAARALQEEAGPIAGHAEPAEGGVVVVIDSDPVGLVAGARAHFRVGGARDAASASGTERIALELPRDATELELAAIDEHGNTVTRVELRRRPEAEAVAAAVAEPAPRDRAAGTPLYARWQLWGAVSLGLAAGGTWAGLSSRSKVSELEALEDGTEYATALDLKDQAESRALQANIAFAAAGATAIAAALLYWREDGDADEDAGSAAVLTPLLGDVVGAAASLRF